MILQSIAIRASKIVHTRDSNARTSLIMYSYAARATMILHSIAIRASKIVHTRDSMILHSNAASRVSVVLHTKALLILHSITARASVILHSVVASASMILNEYRITIICFRNFFLKILNFRYRLRP